MRARATGLAAAVVLGTLAGAAPASAAYGDPMALSAGDLNGDLIDDVAVATRAGIDFFPGGPAGLGGRSLLAATDARQVVAADVNLDQRDDLVVVTRQGVSVFFAGGTLRARSTPPPLRSGRSSGRSRWRRAPTTPRWWPWPPSSPAPPRPPVSPSASWER